MGANGPNLGHGDRGSRSPPAAGAALTVPASAKPTAGEHGEGEGIRVCLQCDENWKKLQGNACLARAGTLDAADI
jgi:hypothetical protein